jgi:hypothetical protein
VQARVGETIPEVALAYDATMATLLAMAGIAEGSAVTGPSIVKNMARLNNADGLAISFGDDPKDFVKAAVDELARAPTCTSAAPAARSTITGRRDDLRRAAAFTFDGASVTAVAAVHARAARTGEGTWSTL